MDNNTRNTFKKDIRTKNKRPRRIHARYATNQETEQLYDKMNVVGRPVVFGRRSEGQDGNQKQTAERTTNMDRIVKNLTLL